MLHYYFEFYEVHKLQSDHLSTIFLDKKYVMGMGLINIYNRLLDEHEIPTKSVTSGMIGIVGDFLAQYFEYWYGSDNKTNKPFQVDQIRLLGLFIESAFIACPLLHYAYKCMEHLVPIHDEGKEKNGAEETSNPWKEWIATFFHVFASICIVNPLSVLSMMVFTSIIEGRTATLTTELGSDFGPSLWVSVLASLLFVPFDLVAYKYLPLKFRCLYVDLEDIIWSCIVSVMIHRSRKYCM